jgi:hypothetical protein
MPEVSAQEKSYPIEGPTKELKSETILPNMELAKTMAAEGSEEERSFAKKHSAKISALVYTVHVFHQKRPLTNVQIYMGNQENRDLKLACTTNNRGRCVVRFSQRPLTPVTFVAKLGGYQTTTRSLRVQDKGILRFDLLQGESIDIFALQKNYNFISGLEGVGVFINGGHVGNTDKFGHLSYVYSGKKEDLVDIVMKNPKYIPESYQTDFVVSGPMTLVRYFSPSRPHPVKLSMIDLQIAGALKESYGREISKNFSGRLKNSSRSHIFSLDSFQEYSDSSLVRDLSELGLNVFQILKEGWQNTDLKSKVDALIVPTLVLENPISLELSVISSTGEVLVAGKETLNTITDDVSLNYGMKAIADSLLKNFPFEGSVLSVENQEVTINLGFQSQTSIEIGDSLDVFGTQVDPMGRQKNHRKIARIEVTKVGDVTSLAKLTSLNSRSKVSRGDIVVFRRKVIRNTLASEKDSNPYFDVSIKGGRRDSQPISQANVYFDNVWMGATNASGRFYFQKSSSTLGQSGILKIIRHGYSPFEKKLDLSTIKGKHTVQMEQLTAFLRLESTPTGATVKVDEKIIGKTPISSAVAVPAGFIKLEMSGVSGYKVFSQVLELEEGTLDLTGGRAISLEVDYLAGVERFVSAGRFNQALDKVNDIPEQHSDYLFAHHLAGEIYLQQLNQPENAIDSFRKVVESPRVKSFNDKRFIGSHINIGLAYFSAAEKIASESVSIAAEHYKKAIEFFDGVEPYLRFVHQDQYEKAIHNVKYHRALSKHKIWETSKEPNSARLVLAAWRDYLDSNSKGEKIGAESQGFVDYATVYFNQAKATLESNQKL